MCCIQKIKYTLTAAQEKKQTAFMTVNTNSENWNNRPEGVFEARLTSLASLGFSCPTLPHHIPPSHQGESEIKFSGKLNILIHQHDHKYQRQLKHPQITDIF